MAQSLQTWGIDLACLGALSFFFVLWRIPETKGMELEQTETLFTRPKAKASA